jgi:hypothetical protein
MISGLTSVLRSRSVLLDTDGTNDDIGQGHKDTSSNEKRTTTNSVDDKERHDDSDNLDDVDDDGVQESVGLTDVDEESSGVGENELHSRDLLATEDTESADEPPSVGRDIDKIPPPGSATLVVLLGSPGGHKNSQFCLGVEVFVVLVDRLERTVGLVVLALLGQPSRRLRDQEQSETDSKGDDDVECDGESPREGADRVWARDISATG